MTGKPRRRRRPVARLAAMSIPTTFDELPDGALVQAEDGRLGVFHRGSMPTAAGLVMFSEGDGVVVDPDDRARFVAWPAYVMGLVLAASRGANLDLSALTKLEEDSRDTTTEAG